MTSLLEIQGLHKRFGTTDVLKGVDCAVDNGEVVAIIGSSGSGKTTLLRCINMLEDFHAGRIVLDGEEIGYEVRNGTRRRKAEKEIARQRSLTGMAFQQFNLFPHLSAAENVMLGLIKVKRMSRDEARALAMRWLDRVGLAPRADHHPGQLSGGQQQRVAIARALINQPPVLFADEPTGNLDSRTTAEILEMFDRLNRAEGITIILVTHDPTVAGHARRNIRLRDGMIESDTIREGPPPTLPSHGEPVSAPERQVA